MVDLDIGVGGGGVLVKFLFEGRKGETSMSFSGGSFVSDMSYLELKISPLISFTVQNYNSNPIIQLSRTKVSNIT